MIQNPSVNVGDIRELGLFPGSGRSPREGRSSSLQYSCLENPMDRGAWWAIESIGSKRVRHDRSDLAFMQSLHCRKISIHADIPAKI